MNPALLPIVTMRNMSNAELIERVHMFDRLSILEGELLKRLEVMEKEEERKRDREQRFARTANPEVRKIVDWAKERVEA